jgi:hypothetical protein
VEQQVTSSTSYFPLSDKQGFDDIWPRKLFRCTNSRPPNRLRTAKQVGQKRQSILLYYKSGLKRSTFFGNLGSDNFYRQIATASSYTRASDTVDCRRNSSGGSDPLPVYGSGLSVFLYGREWAAGVERMHSGQRATIEEGP